MYAWLVVFILPLNSAVNPLLYTFTTPKYRDQIFTNLYRNSARRRRDGYGNSNQGTNLQFEVVEINNFDFFFFSQQNLRNQMGKLFHFLIIKVTDGEFNSSEKL